MTDTEELEALMSAPFAAGCNCPDCVVARGNVDAWLAARDRAVRAQALKDAADALEGKLGMDAPGDLWEFRQWLRESAAAIEGEETP